MRHGLKALALVVLLAGPMAANAVPFEFSYRFRSGDVVTGTLDGDQNGQYVENVTDITVSLNGIQFIGPLYFSSWTGSGWTTNDGTISFDASLNNFVFIDVDYPSVTSYTSTFYVIGNYQDYGIANVQTRSTATFDYPMVAGNWLLRSVDASVPEPGTLGLLGLGLAGLGLSRRRKAH